MHVCDIEWASPSAEAAETREGAADPMSVLTDGGRAGPPRPNDFTTWEPAIWHLLDVSNISFPQDAHINTYTHNNTSKVRSYTALAMILWYDPELRGTQDRLWQELDFAWKATFHADLGPAGLEMWPVDGPRAFT